MTPRYAIATSHPGWHGHALRRALSERGLDSEFVSLEDCRLEISADGAQVGMPGFEDQLPAGVFVREVPGGSLEEVVFYLDILHALEALGVRAYNDAGAIERSVDKARASFLFALHQIPTPTTFIIRNVPQARTFIEQWFCTHEYLVGKPIFGSQGKGLFRLSRNNRHPDYDLCHGVYYLQQYIEPATGHSCDWRVFVVDGQARAAMRREGVDWISNIANGGQAYAVDLDPELASVAEQATAAIGMAYAGVDLMRDREGCIWVTEVNSIPAWRGLQQVCSTDIAGLLIDGFVQYCNRPSLRPAA